ncbi:MULTISPECIES: hypothetical protein [Bacillus]|uniref:hypothetical protein n=1 Tax=Bacillus TaxID=1386 RepID=UPI000745BB39|nr:MULTISPECIES: hypothetical protein [Bacillus]PPA36748.1 hypothetical protein C4E21_09005 [Bacillus subtilis]AMA53972.1 hypothetical protein AN935_17470 [Bacillus inaquosorum]MBT2190677.1 hypothetical protein [Bacillus inaquosorum]MBT3117205.1 hypothetical protein [Bacillus inaquosorum]MBT3120320.1 hypothetical protein [Bacillus inaquosorum]
MKKIMLLLTTTSILSACQPNYTGKYIEIGDSLTEYTKECFKENHIPYQYEKGKLYIPEDAFDTVINTCS